MRREPLTVTDPRLAIYISRVADVYDGSQRVGELTVDVETWWTVTGHLWWKRGVSPRETPHWRLSYNDAESHFIDDVVREEEFESTLAEWGASEMRLRGRTLRLRWRDQDQDR
jgi:hypothetical protein